MERFLFSSLPVILGFGFCSYCFDAIQYLSANINNTLL
jgi:hypothetical protein